MARRTNKEQPAAGREPEILPVGTRGEGNPDIRPYEQIRQMAERQGLIPMQEEPGQMDAASMPALPRKKNVTTETIHEAEARLDRFRSERQAMTERIIENQQYFEFTATSGRPRLKRCCNKFPKSVSAYLFNSVANKHADFMDNMPMPTILPQEESDEETAKILSEVVPCIFDKNDFGERYSENSYEKLIGGTGVYSVVWDGSAENGLGDIRISNPEMINLYWKGGVQDVEESPDLFYVSVENNDDLLVRYPQLKDKLGHGTVLNLAEYVYEDTPNRENMSLVVDWYYKKPTLMQNGAGMNVVKYLLHYCVFSCGEVLYASEDDYDEEGNPRYPNGFYEHGLYPYVLDVMFPLKGSPGGFGYVDIMKNPQEYIDDLDTAIRTNASLKAAPRYMAPAGAGIRTQDLLNPKKNVITYSGMRDAVQPVETPDLPGSVIDVRTIKVDELKETSGNRDFSQGATSSGVTAASAIAALQEAGSKLSRDMIKQSYFTYAKLCRLVIELIRQFYTISRVYRITKGNEQYQYVRISNAMLQRPDENDQEFGIASGGRQLHFDIKVAAQKASPFSRAAQNELAKELYGAGFFNPQFADQVLLALSMMDFDGKDEITAKIQQNATLAAENQQLKANIIQMAQMLASTGDQTSQQLAAAIAQKYGQGQQMSGMVPGQVGGQQVEVNSLGGEEGKNTRVENARQQSRTGSEVR